MTRSKLPAPNPVCIVVHPERGRTPHREHPSVTRIVYTHVWVADDAHPLGGYDGTVTLHRRVNLIKDILPLWFRGERPLYEFTKERP